MSDDLHPITAVVAAMARAVCVYPTTRPEGITVKEERDPAALHIILTPGTDDTDGAVLGEAGRTITWLRGIANELGRRHMVAVKITVLTLKDARAQAARR